MIMLDGDKKETKPPVKPHPPTDDDGGPFVNKIILIMKELKRQFNEWREKRKKKNG